MFSKRWTTWWLGVLSLCVASVAVQAQDAGQGVVGDVAGDPTKPEEKMVEINLPENTNLKALVDFVGSRLKLNIVYDATINGRQITLRTPNAVPLDSLRDLLDSMLKINNMVMVETDVPGVLRVTTAQIGLGEHAGVPLAQGEEAPKGQQSPVVSRIYKLKHASAESVSKVLTPFLTKSKGASIVTIPAHDLLIITEFKSDIARVERMLELTDQPGREISTRFIPVEHLEAEELVSKVRLLLTAQDQIRGQEEGNRYALVAEERTNQLIVAARPRDVDTIEAIIRSLDISLNLRTQVYRLHVVTPTQLDEIAQELVGENKVGRLYKAVADDDSGFLAITATDPIHEQIVELVETIDQPLTDERSPIRFYKLQNADAREVADALSGITGESDLGSLTIDGLTPFPAQGFETPPGAPGAATTPANPLANGIGPDTDQGNGQGPVDNVQVLAYEPMNTIIVIAPPTIQPIYEKLIARLDERRPQVLIEATVVALDTTDDFSLGVEFSRSDSVDGGTLLNFSQFGLTTADVGTGELTLNPGIIGFNGALLDADIAEVVIQALQRDVRSAVMTRPSILVNDNAQGELESLDTEPFESVNANNTVATTTLGGELETGTKIVVKPSISDGNFLKLDYSINVSTFDEERIPTSSGGTLPPGRSENNVTSEVTIPDGSVIVVGGLTREIDSETIQRIPLLGSIPILEYAFSSRNISKRKITVFVFLRSKILRDDKFEDLKVLSGTAAGQANLPSKFPTSTPVEIR